LSVASLSKVYYPVVISVFVLGVAALVFSFSRATGDSLHDAALGVGTSLIAASIAAFILSIYDQFRSQIEASSTFEQFRNVEAAVERARSELLGRSSVEVVMDVPSIYDRALNIVTSSSQFAIQTTDFRVFERSEADQKRQRDYLAQLARHIDARQIDCYRAVMATTTDQCKVLADQTRDLLAGQLSSGRLLMKFFPICPVAIDVLIGDRAVLLAFPKHTGEGRIGLVIWNPNVAALLRSWYEEVVWQGTQLGSYSVLVGACGGDTPVPIKISSRLHEIAEGIK